jgi:hypothetical protein
MAAIIRSEESWAVGAAEPAHPSPHQRTEQRVAQRKRPPGSVADHHGRGSGPADSRSCVPARSSPACWNGGAGGSGVVRGGDGGHPLRREAQSLMTISTPRPSAAPCSTTLVLKPASTHVLGPGCGAIVDEQLSISGVDCTSAKTWARRVLAACQAVRLSSTGVARQPDRLPMDLPSSPAWNPFRGALPSRAPSAVPHQRMRPAARARDVASGVAVGTAPYQRP